jgi:hypothetical protein
VTAWRPVPVPGFEHSHSIARSGAVRSEHRTVERSSGRVYTVRPRLLTPKIHQPSGLRSVCLCRDGRGVTAYIHKLIAAAYGGPRNRKGNTK